MTIIERMNEMDSVQKFISDNQYQLGYIMQEASRQWIEKDRVGALTVGDCNFVVEKYGQYHEILEKMQQQESMLETIIELHLQTILDLQHIQILVQPVDEPIERPIGVALKELEEKFHEFNNKWSESD
ncbi:hypothetical protein [Metasolibacillus meyeri]|uniref:hypothetical protein n=1 Tax=Metasolibacillus meyeri TaxID=1071052 RepID=UPI000D30FB60|nr:hypothetical protein [Metasolibacillus meyeri]